MGEKRERYQNRIELLQGTLDLLILQTLQWGPQHGYGISVAIRNRSGEMLQVDTRLLYPGLQRLEKQKWVAAEWKISENKQRAKYYRLTAAGKRQLEQKRSRWRQLTEAIGGELNEELESHVTMAAEDLVARGESKTAAAQAARRELGNFSLLKEVTQDAWGGRWCRDLLEDSRHGLRILRKNPGFTAVAVLTLALGIGANTAIFSVLDSALLKSLPVAHPEQLVVLTDPDAHGGQFGSQTGDRSLLAYSEFEYLRDHNDLFAGLLAADSSLPDVEVNLGDSSAGSGGKKEIDRVKLVTGDYFVTLGVKPAAGRMFGTEVDRARGGSPIAVVSYVFWRQRFGLNPSMLGRTIRIRRTSFEIVGVAPPEFFGETVGEAPDIWIPMMMQDAIYPGRDLLSPSPQGITNQHMWIQVMARLKPDIPLAQAKTRTNVVFKRMLESASGWAMTAAQCAAWRAWRLNTARGFCHTAAVFNGARRISAVDCVRKRGEPGARSRSGQAKGIRNAHGRGSWPRAADSAA